MEHLVQLPPPRHYAAYRPRPFTRADREKTTVLFGGLTWKHERLVQGVLHNLGYRCEPLPNIAREDLDAGKALIDVGACCPTIFTTGSLARFLEQKAAAVGREAVARDYLFLTAGACGPCRFGQYQESYAMALDGLGLRDFRILLMAQDQMDQSGEGDQGLEVNLPFSLGLLYALLVGDCLVDLEYQTRPYETVAGQTEEILKDCIEELYQAFRDRPDAGGKWRSLAWHLSGGYFTRAVERARRRWDGIEVDRLKVKPRVKITGEFWLQTHEGDGNYNIKRWLEQEGAEVIPPPVAVWLDYLLHPTIRKLEHRHQATEHPRLRKLGEETISRLFRRAYDRLREAAGGLPHALPDQEELRALAAPYYHFELRGGEGHMLIGKALHAHKHKTAHMICELSPYGCMPNTMSIGSMANVMGQVPDLLYAPIEVKGDAEVHALSRCQMILTEAKKRAQAEFEEALAATGLTVERVRAWEERHPEVRRATYQVPQRGRVGAAANYLHHLAEDRGLGARRRRPARPEAGMAHAG